MKEYVRRRKSESASASSSADVMMIAIGVENEPLRNEDSVGYVWLLLLTGAVSWASDARDAPSAQVS
jgi:hypothetical protein